MDLSWWLQIGVLEMEKAGVQPLAAQDRHALHAMICIGVDSDVREKARTFSTTHRSSVCIIDAAGGEGHELARELEVQPADDEFAILLQERRHKWRKSFMSEPSGQDQPGQDLALPYPLFMQWLVEKLADDQDR